MQQTPIQELPPVPGVDQADLATYWYRLVDTAEAAGFRGQSQRTLETQRSRGDGPPYVRVSPRCIRYRLIDLYRHDQQHMHSSTAEYDG